MVITEECERSIWIYGNGITGSIDSNAIINFILGKCNSDCDWDYCYRDYSNYSNYSNSNAGESVGGGTQSTSSGSAGSNTGTYSQKKYDHVKGNTMSTMNNQKDNRPAYETDTNPNHHYIADYRSFGGIKLFKVHDSMGDYIMLDNSITSRKICNLKEAESGKHKFYRRENGKEINIAEIPWK